MRVGVVVNPVAGNGRTRGRWAGIERVLAEAFGTLDVRCTDGPGDGARLALELACGGCDMVIAVGGDGTISEVVDGLMAARAEGAAAVPLAVVPAGTGSDLARGLGLAGKPEDIAARIIDGRERRIDIGRVSYVREDGTTGMRHFVNIASAGLSGATDRAVNAARRGSRLPPKAIFLWHTVKELVRYRFQSVRISVDGGAPLDCRIALVAVANGRYFGGGMMIAPGAAIDDGGAEIVVVLGGSKLRLLRDLRLVYGGAHRGHSSCMFLRGSTVTIEPLDGLANAALLDVDGECPGRIPATFSIIPGALRLRGWDAQRP